MSATYEKKTFTFFFTYNKIKDLITKLFLQQDLGG